MLKKIEENTENIKLKKKHYLKNFAGQSAR